MSSPKTDLIFQAAVERPLSVVFRTPHGAWEGHDYRVEVVTERTGLDAFDVVMDFRALEAALDARLVPLSGKLLEEAGIPGPIALARKLMEELAPMVPPPARLSEIALVDGCGRRIAIRSH